MISTACSPHHDTAGAASIHRVLVVEDHEAFRRLLCELLQQRPDVRIVAEAADGLDAIRQARAHRPDVVMLDIALPTLSGIEVANHIRAELPDAKLMFVTNESSLDVVELAYRRGAHGYVYKPRAQRDVLPIFEEILSGARFVSGGLERVATGDGFAGHRHRLLYWSSDTAFVEASIRFITAAFDRGDTVITALTEAHAELLHRGLDRSRVDVARAVREGRYTAVHVSEVLRRAMGPGWPDATRILEAAGQAVLEAMGRPVGEHARIAACGELSAVLWAQGHVDTAMQLEQMCDQVAIANRVDTLCPYPLSARENMRLARSLCAEHTVVEIS